MHGLGNDFVIIDCRSTPCLLEPTEIAFLADRKKGIGFDQLILLHQSSLADVRIEIYNADGSCVGACGNATRCVASLLLKETDTPRVSIEADGRTLYAQAADNGIAVNMGAPVLDWQDIPMSSPVDTLHVPVAVAELSSAVALSMGNPHLVLFGDSFTHGDIASIGSRLEVSPLFPERTNVEFVSVINRHTLHMRVWERGVGITLACGTGACASVVAAVRRGLVERETKVILDGGELDINWVASSNDVWMTGAAVLSYHGTVNLDSYRSASHG